MNVAYDPSAEYEVETWDVEFRRDPVRDLMARIYQPKSEGPFPVLLDIHGGAWNGGDRANNALMDQGLAQSGVLVVAVDTRWAKEAPYPANIADANYGVRWLKHRAREWRGDPETVGLLGGSSGGHIVELCGMRPRHPDYAVHALPEAPHLDAAAAYVVARSPISDPAARYEHAKKMNREVHIKNSELFFKPWETIFDGNPQRILDRGEPVVLPPLLVLQGELDDNLLPEVQQRFVSAYRAAGGEVHLEIFRGAGHNWLEGPGPQVDLTVETIKAFVARQLQALRAGAEAESLRA